MADTILGSKLMYNNLDVDQTEDTVLAGPGRVYMIHAYNSNAAIMFLRFYDALIGDVTVGSTATDLIFALPILTTTTGGAFNLVVPGGLQFDTGITIACTTGFAADDTGAPGTNDCIVSIGYA